MPKVTIDDREIEVPQGTPLLEAARRLNIDIPTLCYEEGLDHFSSCMMCMVKDLQTQRMMPACSAQVVTDMRIDASSPEVRAARKDTLELLLGEHVGNCEGPCRRACPSDVNIPWINAQIEAGQLQAAIDHLNETLIFPALVERVCTAPCEMVCRRDEYDETVAVRRLLRYLADQDVAAGYPGLPRPAPANGKTVAIVGAGPTGLAAAYCLQLQGYACTLFDERSEPWGEVRDQNPEERVPARLFDAEADKVSRLGARFRMSTRIGRDIPFEQLMQDHDAVVLAIGKVKPETPASYGLDSGARGIAIDPTTFQTSIDKVFCGGDAVRPFVLVAHAVAEGRGIARSVDEYLWDRPLTGQRRRFNSRIGRLMGDELERLVEGYDRRASVMPEAGPQENYAPAEAAQEVGRCLHCECLKPDTCKLRMYADDYDARQDRYLQKTRTPYSRVMQHADVIFEPGKCVKCGLCVRITEEAGEPLGLTFVERGFDVKVSAPFDATLTQALGEVANDVVGTCPTAALSFKSQQLRKMPCS